MAEHFLEEQLERIRELTRQISGVQTRVAELSHEVERERAMIRQSPLHEVRDLRSYLSPEPARDHGVEPSGRYTRYRSRRPRK